MTLTDFLLARIQEDDEAARSIASAPPVYEHFGDTAIEAAANLAVSEGAWDETGAFLQRFADPARVLAELEAKRRIVEAVTTGPMAVVGAGEPSPWSLKMLGILALPYSDHPDYQQEWRA